MSGYPEGKQDDPADTQDRLVRIGSKYQATAPAVADGDNVYLLVDAAGRVLVAGAVASDAVAAGNPVQVGGVVDDTSPASAAEADARAFRATPEGNQIVELYKDNNALLPIGAMPGASDVLSQHALITDPSTTRTTIVTPTPGKKARIIAVQTLGFDSTASSMEWYFGTGATIETTTTKAIAEHHIDVVDNPSDETVYPDGGGPVGAVDDVISIRVRTALITVAHFIVHYREE